MNDVGSTRRSANGRRFAIDFHAHILVPEVYAVAFPHSISCKTADAATDEESRRILKARQEFVLNRMSDVTERVTRMDAMGVDIQVLSSSHVHESTWWAEPKESLRLERLLNDHIADVVASNPARFIGLGGVPLPTPELAVEELRRCMRELGLAGVAIATTARDMELGDARLRPFWAAAQELRAIIYIHPAGNQGTRFQNFSLWNSIGQAFEEAMAIASLMYEGVLDTFPGLKICISHGGGYMPFYMGRILRNYAEKPTTRFNMTKARSNICACFISIPASTRPTCWHSSSSASAPTASCSAPIIRWAMQTRWSSSTARRFRPAPRPGSLARTRRSC